MKNYLKVIRLVATFGQLGFTLITPPVVMALLGWGLQSWFGLGTWVMLVCLLIGLVCAGSSGYRFIMRVLARDHDQLEGDGKKQTGKPVVFNTHD